MSLKRESFGDIRSKFLTSLCHLCFRRQYESTEGNSKRFALSDQLEGKNAFTAVTIAIFIVTLL